MERLVETIYTETLENGGISIDLQGKRPSHGYIVARHACEKKVKENEFSKQSIKDYISRYGYMIGAGQYLGTWKNIDGTVYFDISVNYNSLDVALMVGKEEKQLAIWSIDSKKEIRLD